MVCWLSAPAPAFQTKIHRIQSGGDSIQSAIDAARNGDEIIVGPGIYRERIDFLGKSITLRSESGAEYTLIDGRCQEESPSCSSVVTMRMGEGPDTRLIGFSIAGGRGTRMARDERHRHCGGGLLLIDSSPVISNCLILNNQADEGGAASVEVGRRSSRTAGSISMNRLSTVRKPMCRKPAAAHRVWVPSGRYSMGGCRFDRRSRDCGVSGAVVFRSTASSRH